MDTPAVTGFTCWFTVFRTVHRFFIWILPFVLLGLRLHVPFVLHLPTCVLDIPYAAGFSAITPFLTPAAFLHLPQLPLYRFAWIAFTIPHRRSAVSAIPAVRSLHRSTGLRSFCCLGFCQDY